MGAVEHLVRHCLQSLIRQRREYGSQHRRDCNRLEVLGAHASTFTHGYSFGPGTANALAVGVEGGLVIVSPSCR